MEDSKKDKKKKDKGDRTQLSSSTGIPIGGGDIETLFRDKYKKQNETIQKVFDLKSEFVLDHHGCAHLGTFLKPGRLFITPRYILFYSNILGSKTKKKILYEKILEIKKESTSFVASPIEIQLKFKRYTFASFMQRDICYQNLNLQWKSNKEGVPLDIKIPINGKTEDEEAANGGEEASLQDDQAPQPVVEIKSIWGTGESSNVNNLDQPDVTFAEGNGGDSSSAKPKVKSGKILTLSKMPSLKSQKKRKCFPCFE